MELFTCLRSLKPNVIVGSPRLWNFVYSEYQRALTLLQREGAVQATREHTTMQLDTTFVLEHNDTSSHELEDSLIDLFYSQYLGGRAVGLVTGLYLTCVISQFK